VRGTRGKVVAALLLALACGVPAASPEQVAERFWEALRTGDTQTARACATAASAPLVDNLLGERRIEEVQLGETLSSERSAIVRTSLVTATEADRQHSSFDTHLVREADEWKVDASATEREMTAAIFAASLRQIGEALGQGVQEFSQALEKSAEEMKQAIHEALEELDAELR
jgi:hypothetical protein